MDLVDASAVAEDSASPRFFAPRAVEARVRALADLFRFAVALGGLVLVGLLLVGVRERPAQASAAAGLAAIASAALFRVLGDLNRCRATARAWIGALVVLRALPLRESAAANAIAAGVALAYLLILYGPGTGELFRRGATPDPTPLLPQYSLWNLAGLAFAVDVLASPAGRFVFGIEF